MRHETGHIRGFALIPLIFGMMILAVSGVVISWEVYNTRVSGVEVVETQQVYALAQSGVEFAIGYANDTVNNPSRLRSLQEPGLERSFPPDDLFPGGGFKVVYSSAADTLTSTAILKGSTAKRKLALSNFRDYLTPDWTEDFDGSPQLFDKKYFPVMGPLPSSGIPELEHSMVLDSIDDRSDQLRGLVEKAFSLDGEEENDPTDQSGVFELGDITGTSGEFLIITPTTPVTGGLVIDGVERKALPVETDADGYQNYSVEVKFKLNASFAREDGNQGFGIIFRLHHPTKPLSGPWNDEDLDETSAYALQLEPIVGKSPQGKFLVRWWVEGFGRLSPESGLCGGDGLFFNEDYHREQENTYAEAAGVYKGGFFLPERRVNVSSNPGWGWRDSGISDNAWMDCDNDGTNDMHKLRLDVAQNRFTIYFGTENNIYCSGDESGRFVMHKIIEIDVREERVRRGNCVPNYKTGHIGLRAWNGFQAQIDSLKIWRW